LGPIPLSLHRWGEIWHGVGDMPKFTPSVQCVTTAGRKTSKSASEEIQYRRLALNAMLPVTSRGGSSEVL